MSNIVEFFSQPLPRDDQGSLVAVLERLFDNIGSSLIGLDRGKANLVSAPATSDAPGNLGDIAYDSDYFYACVAPSTWKRAALSTW